MSNLSVRSFSRGEIAPALHARSDLQTYEVSLRQCRNWVVMRQGGATKRPGTEFLTRTKAATKKVRLIPFVFNVRDGNTFVLEFGDGYVRFIQNGAVVVSSGTTPYEIVSPYAEAALPDLQYVQSGDVVTIAHPDYPPYELKRFGQTNWTLTPIVFGPDIAPPTGLTVGDLFGTTPDTTETTGSVQYAVTAISATGDESLAAITGWSDHKPTSVYAQRVQGTATGAVTYNVYRRDGATKVYGFIGSAIGETVDFEDYAITPDPTIQPPEEKVLFAAEDDYPSSVAYYQQRLVFANSNNAPDTVWASRTGHYHNFNVSATLQDDDAITFRLVSGEVNAVRQMFDLGRLVIATEGAATIIDGDGNGVLTPISINPRTISYDGMSVLRPIKAGPRVLFVQAMGSAIRELRSDTQSGSISLVGGDVTLWSSHLVDGFSITDWAWQQEPMHIVWCVRSDGTMLGLTYIPEQDMLAWHRHDTLGFIENVCVVPEGRSHWLYLVVRRRINGSYRRYIERMTTSNVTPVFATPEEAVLGGILTPPAPPGSPPPSTEPVPPPTSATTSDIGSAGATANWMPGNALAPTLVEWHPVSDTAGLLWQGSLVSGGIQSYVITGLSPNTAYEWRARHELASTTSIYLGPSAATQFSTVDSAVALTAPASAPTLANTTAASGSTDILITWPASPSGANSELQIAGPSDTEPLNEAFGSIGTFASPQNVAAFRILTTGTYWFRVRYTQSGYEPSAWAGPTGVVIGVIP